MLGLRGLASYPQLRKWKWAAVFKDLNIFLECADDAESARAAAIPALLTELGRLTALLERAS